MARGLNFLSIAREIAFLVALVSYSFSFFFFSLLSTFVG